MKQLNVLQTFSSLFLLLIFTFPPLFAQNLLTGFSIGSTGGDTGTSIALDGSGNTYIAGFFSGTADFDPSVGTQNLSSAGGTDIFLAKYNTSGGLLWSFSLGSTGTDYASGIATDAAGNIYIAGRFEQTVNFDTGGGSVNRTSAGSGDIFVAKYDGNGALLWVNTMGSAILDEALCIAVDASARVFVGGYFQNTVDFDPGTGSAPFTSNGAQDMFIAQYSQLDGGYRLAHTFGGATTGDGVYAIDLDASSNVYVGGYFSGTVDFDPGPGTNNYTSTNAIDAFLASYSSTGSMRWAFGFGGNHFFGEELRALTVDDATNSVYAAGRFGGIVDFDPSAFTNSLTSIGFQDLFVAKYEISSGKYLQAFQIGTLGGINLAYGLNVDVNSSLYVTGAFESTPDFDPGPGVGNLTSNGGTDVFLAKYDKNGAYQWAMGLGGAVADEGRSIASDGASVYLTGAFQGSSDFDPNGGGNTFISAGSSDIYFTNYSGSPLPVEWEYVNVAVRREGALVEWKTAQETNNDFFAVQRSFDGSLYEQIGTVASDGDSEYGHDYTFLDENPLSGKSFYRLKQVDFDGSFSYSDIVELTYESGIAHLEIYPNPLHEELRFRLLDANPEPQTSVLYIYDLSGKEVWRSQSASAEGSIPVAGLPPGAYLLRIRRATEIFQQRFLISDSY